MDTPKLSIPGWTLAIMASLTIASQVAVMLNPKSFMSQHNVTSKEAAQLIGMYFKNSSLHSSSG